MGAREARLTSLARLEAAATGRPYGEILDRLRAQDVDRMEAEAIRAEALQNGAQLPPPLPAGRPRTPPAGPRDVEAYNERSAAAQAHYIEAGEHRDLTEIVVKSPEWFRWGASAWRDPEHAIGRLPLPKHVRSTLRRCATAGGGWGEWGRGLVATAYLLHRLAQTTKRSGVQVLAGCSSGLLASCIPSASGRRRTLAANTLVARRHAHAAGVPGTEGRHGGLAGCAWRHECGYIEALRQLGIIFAFQPRSDAVPRWQLGRRGYACLQFLLPDSLWRPSASGAPPD